MVLQARRWMPERQLVLVTDNGFSATEFLAARLRQEITCGTAYTLMRLFIGPPHRVTPAPSDVPGPKVSVCRPWLRC